MAGFGETLQHARTRLGVSLKEAEQATRINRHHLATLEEENFSALPPVIYQRGIVRNYAAYLKLDPAKVLAQFEEAHGSGGAPVRSAMTGTQPLNMPGHWAPNFAIIAFAAVLSAIVFAWVYSAFVAEPDTDPTPTAVVPTATPYDGELAYPTQPPTPVPTEVPATAVPTETSNDAEQDNGSSGDNMLDQGSTSDGEDQQVTAETEDATQESDNQTIDESDQPAEEEVTQEATEEPLPDAATDGSGMISLRVEADTDIYVTIYADGEVVYDGNLAGGDQTLNFAGDSFEVYTSNPGETWFVNSCGLEFQMGYDSQPQTFQMTPDQACTPLPN